MGGCGGWRPRGRWWHLRALAQAQAQPLSWPPGPPGRQSHQQAGPTRWGAPPKRAKHLNNTQNHLKKPTTPSFPAAFGQVQPASDASSIYNLKMPTNSFFFPQRLRSWKGGSANFSCIYQHGLIFTLFSSQAKPINGIILIWCICIYMVHFKAIATLIIHIRNNKKRS